MLTISLFENGDRQEKIVLLQPFILLPGKERVVAVCHIDTVAIIEEKNISNKERKTCWENTKKWLLRCNEKRIYNNLKQGTIKTI